MDDTDILERIKLLMDEEHSIRSGQDAVDPERLGALEETLDQCWDLLRQRRARREFGDDPDDASARAIDTVEGYKQ